MAPIWPLGPAPFLAPCVGGDPAKARRPSWPTPYSKTERLVLQCCGRKMAIITVITISGTTNMITVIINTLTAVITTVMVIT